MKMYLVEEIDHDQDGKVRLVYVQATTANRACMILSLVMEQKILVGGNWDNFLCRTYEATECSFETIDSKNVEYLTKSDHHGFDAPSNGCGPTYIQDDWYSVRRKDGISTTIGYGRNLKEAQDERYRVQYNDDRVCYHCQTLYPTRLPHDEGGDDDTKGLKDHMLVCTHSNT